MAELTRYAVFGLFDDRTTCLVRALQHQLADWTGNRTVFYFPVHFTIRGRFWADPRDAVDAFRRFGESDAYNLGGIELMDPVFRGPDLAWLQVNPATQGFREFCRMHRAADAALRPIIVRDEVSPNHAGEAYCPHVTLGWGSFGGDVLALLRSRPPITMVARLVSVALGKYPRGWPVNEDLTIVDALDL